MAHAFRFDDSTIGRYLNNYKADGLEGLLREDYKGRSTHLNSQQEQSLKAHLRQNTYLCAKEIVAYVANTYSISFSISGMHNLLERLGFSYKKPKIIPGKADPQKQAQFIERLNQLMVEKAEEDPIVFADGVHPQHNPQPAYGWIQRGEDKPIKSNTGRQRLEH